jgi:glycosyltransferase involved in cell wall biosynthesis
MELKSIAIVIGGLKRSGAEIIVRDLAIGLMKRGYDVTLCSARGGAIENDLLKAGIPVFVALRSTDDKYAKYRILRSIVILTRLIRHLKNKKYQVLNVHGFGIHKIAFITGILCHFKIISFVFHNNYPQFLKHKNVIQRIKHYFMKQWFIIPDFHIAVSPHVKNWVVENNVIAASRVHVIENGIAPIPLSLKAHIEMRRRLHISPDSFLLIHVGRFAIQKNQGWLIETFSRLISLHGNQYHLLFVGDGHLRSQCQLKVEDLGISKHVSFLGVRDDVYDLLSTADLFVLPSLWEGLPLSMLEAMQSEIPVVAFAALGIADVLNETNAAALIEIGDSEAFVEKVVEIKSNKAYATALTAKGKAFFEQGFSSERMVDQYIRLHRKQL